jgi:hypothetical protein
MQAEFHREWVCEDRGSGNSTARAKADKRRTIEFWEQPAGEMASKLGCRAGAHSLHRPENLLQNHRYFHSAAIGESGGH